MFGFLAVVSQKLEVIWCYSARTRLLHRRLSKFRIMLAILGGNTVPRGCGFEELAEIYSDSILDYVLVYGMHRPIIMIFWCAPAFTKFVMLFILCCAEEIAVEP